MSQVHNVTHVPVHSLPPFLSKTYAIERFDDIGDTDQGVRTYFLTHSDQEAIMSRDVVVGCVTQEIDQDSVNGLESLIARGRD